MKKILLVALVVVPAACGGGSGGGTIPLADLGARVTTALCTFEVRCGVYPDQATCMTANPAALVQLMADVQSGKTLYDGAAASDCLDYITALSCAVNRTDELSSKRCNDAFKGTMAAGEPCFTGEECVSATCDIGVCTTGLACCAGTCAAAVATIPKGGACQLALGTSSCVDGTSCQSDATGATTTCQPLLAAGSPCANFGDCVAGTECQQNGVGGGICAHFPATGQPCDSNGLPCSVVTDTCDATTGTCVARGAVGAACQAQDACILYARCDATALTCASRKGVGGACATDSDCFSSLACTNGACAVRPADPVCP